MGLAAMQGRGFYYPFDLALDSNERIYVLAEGMIMTLEAQELQ